MPIYEYQCQTCDTTFEKRQSFSDEPKADCPNGHKETRRLIAAPVIVFKGSGFYVNDSRTKNGASKLPGERSKHKSETTTESKSETVSESSK